MQPKTQKYLLTNQNVPSARIWEWHMQFYQLLHTQCASSPTQRLNSLHTELVFSAVNFCVSAFRAPHSSGHSSGLHRAHGALTHARQEFSASQSSSGKGQLLVFQHIGWKCDWLSEWLFQEGNWIPCWDVPSQSNCNARANLTYPVHAVMKRGVTSGKLALRKSCSIGP